MKLFAINRNTPHEAPQPAALGVDYIKNGEISLAREDVTRLKSHEDAAQGELTTATHKLARLRAIETDLLSQQSAAEAKLDMVSRLRRAKERLLFELEQDGGL